MTWSQPSASVIYVIRAVEERPAFKACQWQRRHCSNVRLTLASRKTGICYFTVLCLTVQHPSIDAISCNYSFFADYVSNDLTANKAYCGGVVLRPTFSSKEFSLYIQFTLRGKSICLYFCGWALLWYQTNDSTNLTNSCTRVLKCKVLVKFVIRKNHVNSF